MCACDCFSVAERQSSRFTSHGSVSPLAVSTLIEITLRIERTNHSPFELAFPGALHFFGTGQFSIGTNVVNKTNGASYPLCPPERGERDQEEGGGVWDLWLHISILIF